MDTLDNTHPDERINTPAWATLNSTIRHLRHAVRHAPHLGSMHFMASMIGSPGQLKVLKRTKNQTDP